MNTRVKHSVLRAISDDYEDLAIVLRYMRRFTEDTQVTPEEICQALAALINDGLAQAYLLSPKQLHAQKVDFDPGRIDELWLYVTPEGKKLVEELNRQAQ